jgi:predicted ester cyclase
VEDQIGEGDKVVTRYKAGGTHQGELMGIASTGNRIEITGISIMRIDGGKIEEIWENYDTLGMMQQLGVNPPP